MPLLSALVRTASATAMDRSKIVGSLDVLQI